MTVRLYARTIAGRVQLVARWPSGAITVLATQPRP